MSDATSDHDTGSPGTGAYVVLLVIIGLLIWGGNAVYKYFVPDVPTVVSLAAYFVDSEGKPSSADDKPVHLKIRGEAYQSGAPIKEGNAHLNVSTQNMGFAQTVSTAVKDGHFESEDPAFHSLDPDDAIEIAAKITSPQLKEPATGELYLNMKQPTLTGTAKFVLWFLLGFLPLVLLAVFFAAFTGTKTARKNRIAIILSYCIIGLFLAIPLLAPVLLLYAFPGAQDHMIGAPVGLIITDVGKGEEKSTQWAVNIGGYSVRVDPNATPTPATPSVTPAPEATETPANETEAGNTNNDSAAGGSQNSNAAGASANTTTTPESPQNTNAPATNPPAAAAATSTQPPTAGAKPTATQAPTPDAETKPAAPKKDKQRDEYGVAAVQGGLVIPLYVIILSVIGGAINMTRKVPRFQREGEYAEFGAVGLSFTRKMAGGVESGIKLLSGAGATQSSIAAPADKPAEQPPPQVGAEQPDKTESDAANETENEQNTETNSNAPADPPVGQSQALATTDVMVTSETTPELPTEKAQEIDSELDQLVRQQTQRSGETEDTMFKIRTLVEQMQKLFESKKDGERVLNCHSFEDWLGNRTRLKELLGTNWRVELLNQYMYLISAPFLAIVAYYMLDLLGLTKQPVLVLISFSVGLISERILSWLLGIASGYLRTDAASGSAAKA